jgi:glycosyltransferase involved in cell wall biosynthesis
MNSASPLVSFVVPTYNCAAYLPALCCSIQAQTYRNFEVLIQDDGSTDETRSVLSVFEKDPRFKVQGWEKNCGYGATLREALSRGRGEYWADPGADDVLMPDFLERRLALMAAHPNAVMVHGAPEFIDESGKIIPSPYPSLALPTHLSEKRVLEVMMQHNVINCPSVLVRYPATAKILPFFVSKWEYAQDWQLWLLLLAKGNDLLWDERPAHYYRIHGRSLTWDKSQAAVRRAELRLVPLCALKEASQYSPLASAHYGRWRKTLYRLWLLRALKMRGQGVLRKQWLQTAAEAYYGRPLRSVALLAEYFKHAAGVALSACKERQALGRQSFRVAGLAEIDDPIFR